MWTPVSQCRMAQLASYLLFLQISWLFQLFHFTCKEIYLISTQAESKLGFWWSQQSSTLTENSVSLSLLCSILLLCLSPKLTGNGMPPSQDDSENQQRECTEMSL